MEYLFLNRVFQMACGQFDRTAALSMKALLLLVAAALLWSNSAFAADAKTKGTGTLVRLNDFGSDDIAYFAIPSRPPLGGLVVIHDAWGMNEAVTTLVDRLAEEGYIAIAPDLFNGQTTADPTAAASFRQSLSRASALKTIASSVRFLRDSPRFRAAHIGLVGWGLGSSLAIEAAAADRNIEGIAVVGGPLPFDPKKVAHLDAPLLALFDSTDANLAAADRSAFIEFLDREKITVEIHDLPDGTLHSTPQPFPAKARALVLPFMAGVFAKPKSAGIPGFFEKINPFPGSGEAKPAEPVTPDR